MTVNIMKIYHRLNPRLNFLCILCLLASACAGPTVKQRVLMPANADVMKNSKKLAVIDFHGDRKGIFTAKMEAFFTNIRVQGSPYFAVIDPGMMDSIVANNFTVPQHLLQEAAQFGESGDIASILSLFDAIPKPPGLKPIKTGPRKSPRRRARNEVSLPEITPPSYVFQRQDAVRLGQLSGADTILTGAVKWPFVNYERYEKEESECVKYEQKNNPLTPGISSKKCVEYVKHKIPCTKQSAEIEFAIKAVNVDNNQITFAKTYSANQTHSYCNNEKNNQAKDPVDLSKMAMDTAIEKMRHDVAPYEITMSIQLLNKDGSELKDHKEAKSIFDSALRFAKSGHLDRACNDFHRAQQLYNQSAAIYYNLGVCAEVKNDMELALDNYRHAETLLKKPNRYVTQAFARVEDRIEKDRIVADQLR
ncbi:MAG: hypothetical protein OEZ68_03730 [Gammaproteobacteria bacterium]|nr:hypothetical protein [Gammaproteobacteria bacterium]MDH5799895.1 hypothetical protein [Gammaproteobacteria bacterium]